MSSYMTPSVSIILPAYNTEKYIGRCIESILNQSINDWELLIIDDGSADNTYAIAKGFTDSDSRIHVIHTENKGVSSARNTCIDKACGKYLCFIDSDDTVEPCFLEELIKAADENSADIAQCSFCFSYENGQRLPSDEKNSGLYRNNTEIIQAYFIGPIGEIRISSWAKLYRRDRFKDIRFDEDLKIYEDALYTYQCCFTADKAIAIDQPLYNYSQRADSAMSGMLASSYNDYFTVFCKQMEDFRNNKSIKVKIARRESETSLWLISILLHEGKKDEIWSLRKKAIEYYSILFFSNVPFRLKVKLTAIALMPHLYFALLKRRKESAVH